MKAPKQENNFQFELCPEGTHLATLFKIVYLGTIETDYQGTKSWSPLVRLFWELPNEPKKYKDRDGKEVETVFTISREYTFSMGEKANLRKLVSGMEGRALSDEEAFEFDLDTLLGKSSLLNVIHKTSKEGRAFAMVNNASPLMKGMVAPANINPVKIVDVATSPESDINFLHKSVSDKMKTSKEWAQRSSGDVVADTTDDYPENPADNGDEIPF